MDFTRPAAVDPENFLAAVKDFEATQSFGSPALWNVVGRYCEDNRIVLSTLKRVLSAGAPVPLHVLKRMQGAIPADGDVHTPYGATESLPVASISASEVFALASNLTSQASSLPRGTCVGRHFPGIEWKVISISDEPITTIAAAEQLPDGQIGELIVRGPVVTTEYVTRTEANALHKIRDGHTFWHRLGDVGYLEDDRFWFCGRKSHRVITASGALFTIPCEAIFNQHPWVYRSALVGVGNRPNQRPVVFIEPWPEHWHSAKRQWQQLQSELRRLAEGHQHTSQIDTFLLLRALPVDIRHNAKIFREKLAVVAANQRLDSVGNTVS
jgi:acyl-CoA synthetase (AMP-forming)/AMP-acid ligase II